MATHLVHRVLAAPNLNAIQNFPSSCVLCDISFWLVVSTHLKNISQIGNLPPNRGENKKYLKPPTRFVLFPKAVSKQRKYSIFQWTLVLVQTPTSPFRKRVPSLFQKATLERWKRQLNMYQFMIFNVCCSMIGSTLEHILSIWRLIFHVNLWFTRWAPLPDISGVITPKSRVITPVTHFEGLL